MRWLVLLGFVVLLVAVIAAPLAAVAMRAPGQPHSMAMATPAATVTQAQASTPKAGPVATVATVRAWGLNLRACPGVACAVVATLRRGDKVQVTGPAQRTPDGATWWPVSVPGGPSGWVNAKYLNLEGLP